MTDQEKLKMELPPRFALADYERCIESGNSYCRFTGYLSSKLPNNEFWNHILANNNESHTFDRTVLQRTVCMPNEYSGNEEMMKQYCENLLNNEVGHLGLTGRAGMLHCMEELNFGIYEYVLAALIVIHITLVFLVTVYDGWIVKNKNEKSLIWNYSLIHNWKKMVRLRPSKDHSKLRSIQGIRVLAMMIVISCHLLLGHAFTFLDDPVILEGISATTPFRIFLSISALIVQPFFVISAWLCTIQIYNAYKNNGKFTFKDLVILIVNRYFRLAVPVCFVILIFRSEFNRLLGSSPHVFLQIDVFTRACRDHFWSTLFFINSYSYLTEMCNPVTWYLSCDFQFYVITATVLYLILKYKLNEKIVLATLLFGTCVFYGTTIYMHNLDVMFRTEIRYIDLTHFLRSEYFLRSYTSTHISIPTSLLGSMLGIIYVKYRHRNDLHTNKVLVALWYILSIGLNMLVIYISMYSYGNVKNAILGPLLKPAFGLSFGIGILGMSHGLGGPIKKVLESRVLDIMGNFTFGAYMAHILLCFTIGAMTYTLYDAQIYYFKYLAVQVGSFILGAIVFLTIEQPACTLQNKVLPQVKKKQNSENDKTKLEPSNAKLKHP